MMTIIHIMFPNHLLLVKPCLLSSPYFCLVVHIFPTEEEPLEVRELAKHARFPDPRTKRTPTVSSLTKRLRKAYLHSNSGCSHNTSTEDISLCLHFESATAPRDATAVVCVNFKTKNDNPLNDNGKVALLLSPFLFLACVNFSTFATLDETFFTSFQRYI